MPSTSLKSAAIFISTRTHKRDTGWLAGKCKVRKSECFCLSVVVVVVVPPKNVHREIATTLIQFTGSFRWTGTDCLWARTRTTTSLQVLLLQTIVMDRLTTSYSISLWRPMRLSCLSVVAVAVAVAVAFGCMCCVL